MKNLCSDVPSAVQGHRTKLILTAFKRDAIPVNLNTEATMYNPD